MRRPTPIAHITPGAEPTTAIAVLTRLGPLRAHYAHRTNVSYVSRVVALRDDTGDATMVVYGDAAIAIATTIAPGDVVCARGVRRARREMVAKKYFGCEFALARGGDVRAAATCEDLVADATGRCETGHLGVPGLRKASARARRVVMHPWRAYFSRHTPESRADAAYTASRCDAVVAWACAKMWALVRRGADIVDARRRLSGVAARRRGEAYYVDCERVRSCVPIGHVVHIIGRVMYVQFDDETRDYHHGGCGGDVDDDGDGGVMTRAMVWLSQSASSGAVVAVILPPTRRDAVSSDARFRNLEGAIIDVRNARARPRGRDGCDLVCGVESSWRRVGADDVRALDIDARCPALTAGTREMTFDALALAMTSTGFVHGVAAMLSFEACVMSITVHAANGERGWIKIPASTSKLELELELERATYVGCRECTRELAPDANGVYAACRSCRSSGDATTVADDDDDDVPMAYMWRDAALRVRGFDAEETLSVRVRGSVFGKLLGGIDAARMNDDDDDDDDNDDDDCGHSPDYKRMCTALLRALASGRRNSPLKFVVKFPTLDANGMPRSNDLDVIDVSVM